MVDTMKFAKDFREVSIRQHLPHTQPIYCFEYPHCKYSGQAVSIQLLSVASYRNLRILVYTHYKDHSKIKEYFFNKFTTERKTKNFLRNYFLTYQKFFSWKSPAFVTRSNLKLSFSTSFSVMNDFVSEVSDSGFIYTAKKFTLYFQ